MRHIGLMSALMLTLAACGAKDGANETANADANAAAPANQAAASEALSGEAATALMKERHENYEKIGDAMKAIGQELKSDTPDLAKVRASADTIASLSIEAERWFPAGTGPEAGKTRAKAAIWEKPEDFAAKMADFRTASAAFQTAAKGEDLAAIKSAQGDLGKTCKACHDSYREPERD